MGGCFVFDPSVVCGLSVRRGRREICSVRQSRRRMRCVVAVVSLAPSPSEGTNSIDDREGDAASPKEQLVHPEGGVKSPLVVEPSDEFSTGQEGARLEHLRRIGAAGTHTLYRMVEDIRSMMVPSQQVFNIIPSRILSVSQARPFSTPEPASQPFCSSLFSDLNKSIHLTLPLSCCLDFFPASPIWPWTLRWSLLSSCS